MINLMRETAEHCVQKLKADESPEPEYEEMIVRLEEFPEERGRNIKEVLQETKQREERITDYLTVGRHNGR